MVYFTSLRLVIREHAVIKLPKPRPNPQHRTITYSTNRGSVDRYLKWLGRGTARLECPPARPRGRGRYAVSVMYNGVMHDTDYYPDLKVAYETAEAIKQYAGLDAEARQR